MNNNSCTPVFILSCECSGSTMLRYIIDTHSKIACPGHLYLGGLCESLNRMVTATIAQNHAELDEQGKAHFAISETRRIVVNIMESYTEAKNKQIWCEKTPMNLEYLSVLDTHFPNAKYICLYRHCMDVVHSSINLSKFRFLPEHVPYVHRNPDNIIAAMVENWLDKTGRLLDFEAAHQQRCFRLQYESIVMQPEETLTPLFRFLGVEWEKGLMERVFNISHDKGEGDGRAALSSKIREDSVGKGRDVPRAGIPKTFIAAVDELLCRLGYQNLRDYYADNAEVIGDGINEIADIFEQRFTNALNKNRNRYPDLKGIWKLVIKGDADTVWIIDLSNRQGFIKKGDFIADFTLRFSAALLVDLINGTRNAMEAFSQGEIEIDNIDNEESLMDLGRLLLS